MTYTEKEVIAKLGVARCTLVRWRRGRLLRYKKLKNGDTVYCGFTCYISILKFRIDYIYKNNRVYYTQQGFNKIKKLIERRKIYFLRSKLQRYR